MHSALLLNFVWIRHFTLNKCLQSPVLQSMAAGNHNTKTAETHWNLFDFKNRNNVIDLIENSKRHAPVGEVNLWSENLNAKTVVVISFLLD